MEGDPQEPRQSLPSGGFQMGMLELGPAACSCEGLNAEAFATGYFLPSATPAYHLSHV